MTDIIEKHRSIGIVKGKELLFKHKDALRLLDDCERRGAIVVGMSFFKNHDGHVVEMVGNDADYSSLVEQEDAATKTVHEAKELLRDRLPDSADWVSFDLTEPARHRGR